MAVQERRRQMGDILVDAGVLKRVNLTEALRRQKSSKKRLGEVLQEMGVACEEDIALVLAEQYKFKAAPTIADRNIPDELLELVSCRTALTKLVFPIAREDKQLHLAMANPLDWETLDKITFKTGMRVVPWVSTASEVLAAIHNNYLQDVAPEESSAWKILFIAGDKFFNAPAVTALRINGYRLFQTLESAESIEAAHRFSPQLIVMETKLPETNCREVLKVLQNNPLTRGIPVIGIAPTPSVEEEVKLLQLGFFDFLAKPINPALFTARIDRALRLVKPQSHHKCCGQEKSQSALDGHTHQQCEIADRLQPLLEEILGRLPIATQSAKPANSHALFRG